MGSPASSSTRRARSRYVSLTPVLRNNGWTKPARSRHRLLQYTILHFFFRRPENVFPQAPHTWLSCRESNRSWPAFRHLSQQYLETGCPMNTRPHSLQGFFDDFWRHRFEQQKSVCAPRRRSHICRSRNLKRRPHPLHLARASLVFLLYAIASRLCLVKNRPAVASS